MKKSLFFILFLFSIIIFSCNNKIDKNSTNGNDTLNNKSVDDIIFKVKRNYFAINTTSGISEIAAPTYRRGDEIIFVFEDVGKFEFDKNGVNHIELHMKIEDEIGILVAERRNLLGEKGNIKTDVGYLKNPNAKFQTYMKDKPGNYSFTLTIVDLIKKDSITVTSEYFLE